MGAWGTGIFENDQAMDFVSGLASSPETTSIRLREALETAAHMDDYLELPEGNEALAAAAIVACSMENCPVEPADPAVEDQLRRIARRVPPDLAPLAVEAIDRVLGDRSEYVEVWEEGNALSEARVEVEAVRQHLEAA